MKTTMKKCKNLFWIAAIPLLTGLASCSDKLIDVEPPIEQPSGPIINVPLTFSVEAEGLLVDGKLQKEMPIEGRLVGPGVPESDVKNIWVFQFNGTDPTSKLIGAPYYVTDPSSPASMTVPLVESGVEINRLVFVANVNNDNLSAFGALTVGTSSYADMLERVKTLSSEGGSHLNTSLIMSSTVTHVIDATLAPYLAGVISTGTPHAGNHYPIHFVRSLAKIQLNLSFNGAALPNYRILSVQLKNVSNNLYFLDNLKWGGDIATIFPDLGNLNTIDYTLMRSELSYKADDPGSTEKDFDSDLGGTGSNQTFTWYVPRNVRGAISNSSVSQKNAFAPQGSTYIEIMAITNQAAGGEGVIYRIYPGFDNLTDFSIVPNYKYIINLEIVGPGTAVDTRVENMGTVTFSPFSNCYILNPPSKGMPARKFRVPLDRVKEYWESDGGANGYSSLGPDGAISPTTNWRAELMWQDEQNMVRALGNDANTYVILEKSTGTGYTGQYIEFTVPSGTPRGNCLIAFRTETATPGAYSNILWSWHLWITDYNPNQKINVQGSVWTYPVTGGQVERYGSKLFGYLANATPPTLTTVTDYTYTSENSNTYAIGHTDYAPYTDKVMMDRNIGAMSTAYNSSLKGNFYYQYGRKDPIRGSNNFYDIAGTLLTSTSLPVVGTAPNPATNFNIPYAINNPHLFLSGETDWAQMGTAAQNYVWFDSKMNYNLGGAGVGRNGKSIYDPCPEGWKVPIDGTWADFRLIGDGQGTVNAASRGLSFNQGLFYWPLIEAGSGSGIYPKGGTIFYPAAGRRISEDGSLLVVGSSGYGFSSASEGQDNGYSIFFTLAEFRRFTYPRSRGFTVRCVSVF